MRIKINKLMVATDFRLLEVATSMVNGGIVVKQPPVDLSFNEIYSGLLAAVGSRVDEAYADLIPKAVAAMNSAYDEGLRGAAFRSKVLAAMDKIYEDVPEDLAPVLMEATVSSYTLEKTLMLTELNITSHFDLVDLDSVKMLRDNGKFWIGDVYNKTVRERINTTMGTILEQGLGREEAADMIYDTFNASLGVTRQRSSIVASSAMTTSRTFSRISAFEQAAVAECEFFNPLDERTSDICEFLAGRVFRVESMAGIRDGYLAAEDPDGVREAQPWVNMETVRDIVGDAADEAVAGLLAAENIGAPPLHGECRSELIITSSGKSYVKLEGADGNEGALYYSIYLFGAMDLYDLFVTEQRDPMFGTTLIEDFVKDFSYDSEFAELALESMKNNEPLVPVPIVKRSEGFVPLDYPHLVAASAEFGFTQVPTITVK